MLSEHEASSLCWSATRAGHIDSVKYLLQSFPKAYSPPIVSAVLSGNVDVVKYLLDREKKDSTSWALDAPSFAIRSGSLDMLKYSKIIQQGGWSQAHLNKLLALAGAHGHVDMVHWLREQGAEWPEKLWGVMSYTNKAYTWHLAALQYAIQHGCSWGDWPSHICVDLVANLHTDEVEWAHANGCLCGNDCPMRHSS
jgi:hypothetical protein